MAPSRRPEASGRPDCLACRHFFVDWAPPIRRGCRAYAFSCDDYPSAEVLRVSGEQCKLFAPKTGSAAAKKPRRRFT